jgi:hypothetical protein
MGGEEDRRRADASEDAIAAEPADRLTTDSRRFREAAQQAFVPGAVRQRLGELAVTNPTDAASVGQEPNSAWLDRSDGVEPADPDATVGLSQKLGLTRLAGQQE